MNTEIIEVHKDNLKVFHNDKEALMNFLRDNEGDWVIYSEHVSRGAARNKVNRLRNINRIPEPFEIITRRHGNVFKDDEEPYKNYLVMVSYKGSIENFQYNN